MESAKLAKLNGHLSSVRHSPNSVKKKPKDAARSHGEPVLRKMTVRANTKPGQPVPKKTGRKPKAEKLVCRYCGSDDLAPSFIRRRDRCCRECFGQRYGSAARAKTANKN